MTLDEIEAAFDTWYEGERDKQRNDEASDLDFHAVFACCMRLGWQAAYRTLGKLDAEGGLDSEGTQTCATS